MFALLLALPHLDCHLSPIGSRYLESVQVQAPINQLTKQEKSQGFRLLFDGKSVEQFRGWKKLELPKGWQVVDGELRLVKGPEGGDIVLKEEFADFDLRLEWKVEKGGNSGIFFRSKEGQPMPWATGIEMQVLDDKNHHDGEHEITSAGSHYGMYARSKNVAKPADEWNAARIVAKGKHVQFWLNGTKVVDYTIGDADWFKRKEVSLYKDLPDYGMVATGLIVLQDHGNQVSYRTIRIKKL